MSFSNFSLVILCVSFFRKIVSIFKYKRQSSKCALAIKEFNAFKRNIKIAWIEDDLQTIPRNELKNDNFAIDYIKHVTVEGLIKIEASYYNIVILDIKGVIDQRLVKGDGLGLLQWIKQKTPQTCIIVCSGEFFDTEEAEILHLSDYRIKKPASYTEIKDRIEKAIKLDFYLKDELNLLYTKHLKSIPENKRNRIKSLIESTCTSEITKDELRSNLDSLRIAAGSIRDIIYSVETILSLIKEN